MDEALPRVTSRFTISGDGLEPTAVTQAVDLEPTEVGRKGVKRRPESLGALRISFWSVELKNERIDDIDDGMSRLLDRLWPKRKNIISFLKSTVFNAGFGTTVTIHEHRPLYCLSPFTLERMTYFNARYCMDIYDYSN